MGSIEELANGSYNGKHWDMVDPQNIFSLCVCPGCPSLLGLSVLKGVVRHV